MRNIKLLIIALLILGSCKNMDFGDINDNPIGPTEPSSKDLLTGGIMNFFNNTGRDYFTNPTFYVQWHAQNIYTSEMQYAEAPIDWNPWYVQVLSNFKTNIDYIDANRNESSILAMGDPNNQIGVNKVMMAYVFKYISDIYGDIPYTEALDPNNKTPKYDNQIDLYKGIINDLKAARDMMNPANGNILGDPIYGGDIAKWQKLANSLILNAALQLSDVDPAYAQTEFNNALSHSAGVIETLADEAWIVYSSQDRNLQNPYSRLRRSDYLLTKEFTDALQGEDPITNIASCSPIYSDVADARLNIFSNDPSVDGKEYSCSQSGGPAQMSGLIWNANAPLPFFTAAWVYLDRAEASARGWTTEDFDLMLTNAIEKSYETLSAHYGVDITPQAAAFAAARVAHANDNTYGNGNYTDTKIAVVAEEKWVSYFPMGFPGWTQWRRLDIPMLTPHPSPLNSTGQIPTRYKYPVNESTLNPQGYQMGIQDLNPSGADHNDSKIPWDVN